VQYRADARARGNGEEGVMTSEEKVKQVYPDAWYRIAGPRHGMIRAVDSTIILAESWRSRNERNLWKQAWVKIEASRKSAHKGE